VVLADGAGNIKLQVNENGAVGVGTTPTYGTAGQLLTSSGTGSAPQWTNPPGYVTAEATYNAAGTYTLISIPITNGMLVISSTFSAINIADGKSWIHTKNVATNGVSVDTSANNDLASIGGTTRAATINFSVNGTNLDVQVIVNSSNGPTKVKLVYYTQVA
jgi:hypothetical protein